MSPNDKPVIAWLASCNIDINARLNAREISLQNTKNLENICHIAPATVITSTYSVKHEQLDTSINDVTLYTSASITPSPM